jgi:hypothetical protein
MPRNEGGHFVRVIPGPAFHTDCAGRGRLLVTSITTATQTSGLKNKTSSSTTAAPRLAGVGSLAPIAIGPARRRESLSLSRGLGQNSYRFTWDFRHSAAVPLSILVQFHRSVVQDHPRLKIESLLFSALAHLVTYHTRRQPARYLLTVTNNGTRKNVAQ